MRRALLAIGLMAQFPLLGCGAGGPADAGYVDAGKPCTKADECPALRCLPDGGQADADAGNVPSSRACVFSRCQESCT